MMQGLCKHFVRLGLNAFCSCVDRLVLRKTSCGNQWTPRSLRRKATTRPLCALLLFLYTFAELRLIVDLVSEADALALALPSRTAFERFPPAHWKSIQRTPRPKEASAPRSEQPLDMLRAAVEWLLSRPRRHTKAVDSSEMRLVLIGLRIEAATIARHSEAMRVQALCFAALRGAAAEARRERVLHAECTAPTTPEPSLRLRALRALNGPRRGLCPPPVNRWSPGGRTLDLCELGYDALELHVPEELASRWPTRRAVYGRRRTPEPSAGWSGPHSLLPFAVGSSTPTKWLSPSRESLLATARAVPRATAGGSGPIQQQHSAAAPNSISMSVAGKRDRMRRHPPGAQNSAKGLRVRFGTPPRLRTRPADIRSRPADTSVGPGLRNSRSLVNKAQAQVAAAG